jgi:hypothetical protein
MTADFFAPFRHGEVHVIFCRGCGRAWRDAGHGPGCTCTCTDPAAPGYEDWAVDPEFELPEGAWAT